MFCVWEASGVLFMFWPLWQLSLQLALPPPCSRSTLRPSLFQQSTTCQQAPLKLWGWKKTQNKGVSKTAGEKRGGGEKTGATFSPFAYSPFWYAAQRLSVLLLTTLWKLPGSIIAFEKQLTHNKIKINLIMLKSFIIAALFRWNIYNCSVTKSNKTYTKPHLFTQQLKVLHSPAPYMLRNDSVVAN